ncbi:uncharacterized protein LOC125074138 [Vanessa atalanta]|uniref:uncharacterized protein LOC125074138 n=1 Tax=Vanessa atalanta TaxID=42275 RepID=UPI001FCD8E6D|nr:uncharacterized protein LOC125074138 [Vanessa atalanta]
MAAKICFIFFVLFFTNVKSDSLFEKSYEYVMNLGKNLAPSFNSFMDCFGERDAWSCTREMAGKLLDSWDKDVDKQRRQWADAADAEVRSSGRSFDEMPSKLGEEIELSLTGITDFVQRGMARALSRKKHDDGGGIDSITISTSANEKKKMKKKKQKPPKIQLIQPVMMPMKKMEEKGRNFGRVQSWVVGQNETARRGRDLMTDAWSLGAKALDAMAEHALDSENSENGIVDRSSVEEQRGKKKKKKKAILKLLILGAVLKAKIGTLLQILSFKLQVKFFIIALIGLAINLARFWVELKNKHQQPQKVIYYEHAQHQHHYEHEEEPGWGPWSRSMEPEDAESELGENINNSPYRAHEKAVPVYPPRPLLTLS